MRRLSETLSRLRQAKSLAGQPSHTSRLTEFDRPFANPGQLKAWTYLPAELAPSSPLVVVLHGCTQTAGSYDHHSGWSELADRCGFALLFAEQQRSNNPNGCFNWFAPPDYHVGQGEVASIAAMTQAVQRAYGLDDSRTYITGLSAGGAMASACLAAYPDLFAGGAIIAGLPYGCASTIPEAFERMRGQGLQPRHTLEALLKAASPSRRSEWPSFSVWHGSSDATVSSVNQNAIIDQWSGVLGIAAEDNGETVSPGCRRKQFFDRAGRVRIEAYRIDGMGHGTPIDASDIGRPGPFMLDVGVSSTRMIAASWGLHEDPARSSIPARAADAPMAPAHPPANPPDFVNETITKALRSAGLMR